MMKQLRNKVGPEVEFTVVEDNRQTQTTNRVSENLEFCEVMKGHTSDVTCLVVVNDYLASGSQDNTVKLWNLETKQLVATLGGHTDFVLSLTEINGYLVSSSQDTTIKLWSIETREEVVTLSGHTDSVRCLTTVSNYLVSGSEDKTIKFWNVLAREQVATLEGHTDAVSCLTTIKDYLVSGSEDTTIRLWDTETKQQVAAFEGNPSSVLCLAPVSKYLACGVKDTVRLWDTETKQHVGTLKGHKHTVCCLASIDGYLVSSSRDSTIKVWEVETRQELAVLKGHTDSACCLTTARGYLISGSSDRTVRLWNIGTSHEVTTLRAGIGVLCLAKINEYLAFGSSESTIFLNDITTKEQLAVLEGHTDRVSCLERINDYLASGSWDNTIKLWNVLTKQEVATFEGHTDDVNALAVANGYLVSASNDGTIRLWSIETKKEVATLGENLDLVLCLTAINDYLASGSSDSTIRLWNLDTKEQVATLEGHTDAVSCLATIKDYLVSGSEDTTIRLWDTETKQQVAAFKGHTGGVLCLAAVEDYLVSGSEDSTIRFWNIETQQQEAVLNHHTFEVFCLATIKGYLASGSNDGTLKLTKLAYKYRFIPGSNIGIALFNKLAKSKAAHYHKSMNSLAIMPRRVNMLHILAHQGRDKALRKALNQGCCFLESESGKTPLTVSMDKIDKRSTEVIFKHVAGIENKVRQRSILLKIYKDLPRILKTKSAHLNSVCEVITSSFNLSTTVNKLPQYIKTHGPLVNPSDRSSEPKDVRMGRTQLKFNFLEGSQDSLNTLKALENTERSECLRSDFVQTLVGYKWDKFKWVFWLLAFLNLLNVGLLMGVTFSESTFTRKLLTGIFLANNSFFSLFEALQVFSLKRNYFTSAKNYLDLTRLFLGYFWANVSFVSEFGNLNSTNILTLVTSLLFWAEGVNAFRIFKSTRYYIWLIQEVIKDIRGFLGLLAYFVTAYCSVIGTTNSAGFLETFKSSYYLLLGNFDRSELGDVQWVVFVLGSLLNLIVMLNLLISIISESFDRITFEKRESETRIRLGLILELENCLFWKRSQEELAYLCFIQEYTGEAGGEEWESRVRKLYNDTQVIKNKIQENSKEVNQKLNTILELLQKPMN